MHHSSLHHQYSIGFTEALQKMVSVSVAKALLIFGCRGNRRSRPALLRRCLAGTRSCYGGALLGSPAVTMVTMIEFLRYLFLFLKVLKAQSLLLLLLLLFYLILFFQSLPFVTQTCPLRQPKVNTALQAARPARGALFPTPGANLAALTQEGGGERLKLKESWPPPLPPHVAFKLGILISFLIKGWGCPRKRLMGEKQSPTLHGLVFCVLLNLPSKALMDLFLA